MHGKPKKVLVLGGGGAKGCYEIGAWKFFEENGMHFDAVIGTSVGALNAGLIAMNRLDAAVAMWEQIELLDVVAIPRELLKGGKLSLKGNFKHKLKRLKESFVEGRLDTTPLRRLIEKYLQESALRSGKTDLGIVAFNATDLKPEIHFLNEIPKGELADYFLASASFPLFVPTRIKGKKMVDGGVYDNLPYRIAKERGYKDITLIDISGFGINLRPDVVGTRTLYVKNSLEFGTASDLWGILKFEPQFIRNFMQLGYLDTAKAMGRYVGFYYSFDIELETLKALQKKLFEPEDRPHSERLRHLIHEKYLYFLTDRQKALLANAPFPEFVASLLPNGLDKNQYAALGFLEWLAFCLGLDCLTVWTLDSLFREALSREKASAEAIARQSRQEGYDRYYYLYPLNMRRRLEIRTVGVKKCHAPFEYYWANEALFRSHPLRLLNRQKRLIQRFKLIPAFVLLDEIKAGTLAPLADKVTLKPSTGQRSRL